MYTAVQKFRISVFKNLKKLILLFSKDFKLKKRDSKDILLENISILNMLFLILFFFINNPEKVSGVLSVCIISL